MNEKKKTVYEVVIVNGDTLIKESVLAFGMESAKMIMIAKHASQVKEETEVLVRPFCH